MKGIGNDMEYLSLEEQFAEILNPAQIMRIKDNELRKIRMRYWNMFHKAFLDEHGIPDQEIGNVYERIKAAEQAELQRYKEKHGIV